MNARTRQDIIEIAYTAVTTACIVLLLLLHFCQKSQINAITGRLQALELAISSRNDSYLPQTQLDPNQLPLFKQKPLERKLVRFRVTAYCADSCCCGDFADGITASGHKIKQGDKFVAAPPEYAFGTIMDIPEYGRVEVLDRGGAIKGNRIDLYMPSHQSALNWGIKYLDVEIVK